MSTSDDKSAYNAGQHASSQSDSSDQQQRLQHQEQHSTDPRYAQQAGITQHASYQQQQATGQIQGQAVDPQYTQYEAVQRARAAQAAQQAAQTSSAYQAQTTTSPYHQQSPYVAASQQSYQNPQEQQSYQAQQQAYQAQQQAYQAQQQAYQAQQQAQHTHQDSMTALEQQHSQAFGNTDQTSSYGTDSATGYTERFSGPQHTASQYPSSESRYAQGGTNYDTSSSPTYDTTSSEDYDTPALLRNAARSVERSPMSEPSVLPSYDNSSYESSYESEQPGQLTASYAAEAEGQSYFDPDDPADASFYDEDYGVEDFEEDEPRSRKTVLVAFALVGALAVGGGVAYAYKNGVLNVGSGGSSDTASKQPPLIAADNTPVKVKPDNPGGKDFPNQNKLIYDRLPGQAKANGTPEKMVSREEPVITTSKVAENINETKPTSQNSDAKLASLRGTQSGEEQGDRSPADSETKASTEKGGPRKVKTLVVRPDGTVLTTTQPEASEQSQEVAQPQGVSIGNIDQPEEKPNEVSQASAAAEKPAEKPTGTISTSQQASGVPVPAAKPKAASSQTQVAALPKQPTQAAKPAAQSSGGSSKFVVQIAARRTQTDALATFANLQQKYTSLLDSYGPIIQRADLGSKGIWYRLRVGPMGTRDTANDLCKKLKNAGLKACIVRPM